MCFMMLMLLFLIMVLLDVLVVFLHGEPCVAHDCPVIFAFRNFSKVVSDRCSVRFKC